MATGNAQGQDGVIVWCWKDDTGSMKAYESHVSNFVEQNYILGLPSADLGVVDPFLTTYTIDFVTFSQTRTATGRQRSRKVQRKIYLKHSSYSNSVLWEFEGDFAWEQYSCECSSLLEDAFSKNIPFVDLGTNPPYIPYYIDIRNMTQTRVDTNKIRNVRRRAVSNYLRCSAQGASSSASNPVNNTTQNTNVPQASVAHIPTISQQAFHHSATSHFRHLAQSHPNPGLSGGPARKVARLVSGSGANVHSIVPLPVGPVQSGSSQPSSSHQGTGHSGLMPSINIPMRSGAQLPFPYPQGLHSYSRAPTYVSVLPPRRQSSRNLPGASSSQSGYDPRSDPALNGQVITASGSGAVLELLDTLTNMVTVVTEPPDTECSICLDSFIPSKSETELEDERVVRLEKCKHMYHHTCIDAWYENDGGKNGCVQCPTCKTIYGVKNGTCPPGNMDYYYTDQQLPGYENHGSITIHYNIRRGIQGPEHPNPNRPFHTIGFPRTAYLPSCDKGIKVLKLLIKAFERRLTFTIGTSITNGISDCVVWNEIHHKTEVINTNGHGYPDPNYLDNVLQELAAQGVIEETEKK